MATTIVTKSGSGAPTASDLVGGELAVDLTNKRLYTEDSGGTVLELGTNPSGNITFGDNGKAIFGAGSDLQIYHDSNNSYIKDAGTGNLYINANELRIGNADNSKDYIHGNNGAEVKLYYNNALKLATTATGIDVTGSVTADGLDVSRSGNGQIALLQTSASRGFAFESPSDTALQIASIQGSTNLDLWANTLSFSAGGSQKMLISSAGNVGIGTATPTAITNYTTVAVNGTTGGLIDFENGEVLNSRLVGEAGGLVVSGEGSRYVKFHTNNVERLRIDAEGRVGINTTADYSGVVNIANRLGDYCIGLTDTESNTAFIIFRNSADTAIGSILRSGTSAVAYNTSSDQRLKENIEDADDAGSKIDAIQVRKFDWKADGSHQDYGMVAQELQAVAPEAVSAPEDPEEMMGVDYSKLVPMMFKEIQSLRARINALEAE